jgi:hypothetical protein
MIQQYQDLLSGQTQLATQQYQTTTQTAAEQASYDISGAYANYLKQQRNIAAQGSLESGYKEEVGDVLQQQYQSAYSQAKSTQAATVASAQAQYAKNLSAYEQAAEKAKTQIFEAAQKKASIQANLYKAAEDYSKLSESEYDVYAQNEKTGKFELTSWGKELMRKGLLENAGAFEQYLEDEGLTSELEYYYTNPQGIREELFGITETLYKPSVESTLSAVGEGGKTQIDTLNKPTINMNANDFSRWDWGESGHNKFINKAADVEKYALEQLGLSREEIFKALGANVQPALAKIAHGINPKKQTPAEIEQKFNEVIAKLDDYAKLKYIER